MATGIAINIGLNGVDATKYNGWQGTLAGCEFDAIDMNKLAKDKGFQAQLLLTADATSANVLKALNDAATRLKGGDILFLSYSGHGGQVPDLNGDEPDGADETWVLYDRQLVDDELFSMWSRFAAGVRIFVLSDSCHSGSVVKALEFDTILNTPALTHNYGDGGLTGSKALPFDVQRDNYAQNQATYDKIQKEFPDGEKVAIGARVLLISGCQDEQLSSDGDRNGLFTQTLLKVWNKGHFNGSYIKFQREIKKAMPLWQTPNLFKVGAPNKQFEAQEPFTL